MAQGYTLQRGHVWGPRHPVSSSRCRHRSQLTAEREGGKWNHEASTKGNEPQMYNTTEKALKNILLNKSSLTHRSIQFGFFEILGKAKLTESDRRLISFCLLPGVRGID